MFKKILDWLGPNLDVYKVENANDVGAGLVRHKWQGEQTATQIGTTLTSDILNNFQKGLIPFVETSRAAGTNKDIYSITVIGLKEFGIFEGLKILIQIDNQNQYDDVVIKTDNTEYPLYIIKNGVGISPKKGYLRNKNFYFITFKGNAFYLNTGNTFGTEEDTFLEGKRLSEIIGLEFGGNIQDTGMKSVGKFYFDTVNKYYYECIVNNNLTYNDVTKFRPISNKPLSDRLENLFEIHQISLRNNVPIGKVFKTDIKIPNKPYKLIYSIFTGNGHLVDLNTASQYAGSEIAVNLGATRDGFLQYSVAKNSSPIDGRYIDIMFVF